MIETRRSLLSRIYDVEGLIRVGGTAGIFAAAGFLDLPSLLFFATLAAIAGNQVGYAIGYRSGPAVFKRDDSRFFKRAHLLRAQAFYERHGGKTVLLARFVPIVRTFAPLLAGVGRMGYRRFVGWNLFGGFAWVWGMTLLGFGLGKRVPNIEAHLHIVILLVVLLSLLPGAVELWRDRKGSAHA